MLSPTFFRLVIDYSCRDKVVRKNLQLLYIREVNLMGSNTCGCGVTHSGHICLLKSQGLTKEVEHITDKPTVACFTCGVEANAAENVCMPVPIE